MDLLQDSFGLLMAFLIGGNFVGYALALVCTVMFIQDLTSIWLVTAQKPFIYFNSPLLEQFLFWVIMLNDLVWDFAILGLVYSIWEGVVEYGSAVGTAWWSGWLLITATTFLSDIEQVILKVWFYEQGELDTAQEDKFKSIEGNNIDA